MSQAPRPVPPVPASELATGVSMAEPTAAKPRISIRGAALAGGVGGALLLVELLVWAGWPQIAGAVVAQGAVTGKPKTIQHLDGGIVSEIFVSDGDYVTTGQPIMRLDDTLLRTNLEIYRNRLAESQAERDRLVAERNGDPAPVFQQDHPLLAGRDLAAVQATEQRVFEARAEIQAGRKAQLEERIRQFGNQVDGVFALISAKEDQVGSMGLELDRLRSLQEKQLVREPQVLALERAQSDLLGQIAEHISEQARVGNSIQDARLEILQTDRQFREQAVTDLRDVTTSIEELTQQILTTEKQLEWVIVHAPEAGYVHEMQIVTIGGVVSPRAVIAQAIVASGADTFELWVAPVSVDQIWAGQEVRLHFSAFNQRTTQELTGEILQISPTTAVDEVTGQVYFLVFATISPDELARLGDLNLVPGMPVEAFIDASERPVLG